MLAEQLADAGGEHGLASAGGSLQCCVVVVAVELAVDADQLLFMVDICPGEAEGLADAEAGVGEELEQGPVAGGAGGEDERELLAFQDRDRLGLPAWFLAAFKLRDGVAGEPTAADGEGANLVQRDQRDHRGGGGECDSAPVPGPADEQEAPRQPGGNHQGGDLAAHRIGEVAG